MDQGLLDDLEYAYRLQLEEARRASSRVAMEAKARDHQDDSFLRDRQYAMQVQQNLVRQSVQEVEAAKQYARNVQRELAFLEDQDRRLASQLQRHYDVNMDEEDDTGIPSNLQDNYFRCIERSRFSDAFVKHTPMTESCMVCLDDVRNHGKFQLGCPHPMCRKCMVDYVSSTLKNSRKIPRCPEPGCPIELNPEILINAGWQADHRLLLEKFESVFIEETLLQGKVRYCPNPRCATPYEENEEAKNNNVRRRCVECKEDFCSNCKTPWHQGMDCAAFTQFKRNNQDYDDASLELLASRNSWKHCPKCDRVIEKSEGCNHMTCRCAHEFCFVCSADWPAQGGICTEGCALFEAPAENAQQREQQIRAAQAIYKVGVIQFVQRGFGFIRTTENAPQVYFQVRDLRSRVSRGDVVRFRTIQQPGYDRERAIDITLIHD
jgi:hypothetical protein